MATWSGTTPYATKKQLVSSITGLYDDLQDFSFSTITSVSTLTVKEWLSVPTLYVSDIQGANIDISGITITKDGLLNAPIVSLSSLSFKGLDKLFDLDVSFDLGLGDALGGFLGGLGALVGGGLIAVGTGAGLAIQGAEQGIATMVAGRPQNFINSNVYETINFTTQLQVSTIGNAYPLYSTIIRTVSSPAADSVPGKEIFVSTFFNPGTTCIRSVSDPFNLISGNSNLNTSTIQSFGQWVPLPESPALVSSFNSLDLSNATDNPLLRMERTTGSNNMPMINSLQNLTFMNEFNFPFDSNAFPYSTNYANVSYHRDEYLLSNTYISSPYIRFQSTLTTSAPDPYYIRSTISTPCEFTWNGTIGFPGGDFAIVEPDETGFRSTATMDFIALNTDLLIQWGLSINNHNSTIAAGTAKRVSWDILANTSNFIDIPPAVSTFTTENTQQIFGFQTNPHEIVFQTLGTGMNPSRLAYNIQAATFGAPTTLDNRSNYPYQFNSNVYVNGTLEVETLIALSSIFAVSTFVDTQISTQSVLTDYIECPEINGLEGYFSTIKASYNYNNDYTHMRSRVRFMGNGQPIGIITGTATNFIDETRRFEFQSDTDPQAMYLHSYPANTTLMYIFSTNIEIPNLTVDNLTAESIVYSNADVPILQTSTISFGWTGSFTSPVVPNYALQQTLQTPAGTYWSDSIQASNQVINIMNFSNTVNMAGQQFSTPLTYINNYFGASNIQGWASTIFYNAQTTPARAYLESNAGTGELSFQGQTYGVIVNLNTAPNAVGGVPVNVPVGSTYKFTCDGTTWTTNNLPPSPGFVSYTNNLKMAIDYETVNITTTDTLNLNAEKINLNGIVNIPNATLSNLYTDGFVSTSRVVFDTTPPTGAGLTGYASYTGSYNTQPLANVFAYSNIVNSTDFLPIYTTLLPNRGFNMFNSYNQGEWNNAVYNVDITALSGSPIIILGDIIQTSPPFTPYSGQFWINNDIDSPASPVPIYVNREGYLSTIGIAAGDQFTRVFTNDGTNWSLQPNAGSPQGITSSSYSNIYSLQMTSDYALFSNTKPVFEKMPLRNIQANKIMMNCPQIRVATFDSPSFVSREAGFEYGSYFDADVVFTGSQSDALNPIVNNAGNLYYSVQAWSAQTWFSRMRTESLGIQGFDIDAIPILVSGTTGDYIWASARYINVNGVPAGDASIRENYFMTPKNYHTDYGWLGQ